MTGHEVESAVMLIVILLQLLKICGESTILIVFPRRCHWVVVSSFPKALPLG
jgi:hypothetical protein